MASIRDSRDIGRVCENNMINMVKLGGNRTKMAKIWWKYGKIDKNMVKYGKI
jgi:hypothetical protein